VLERCRRAGLVTLGHVALDGTKVRANASKHKAMSYSRMGEAERQRQAETTGRKPAGRPPQVSDPAQATPDPKAQRNFTDPESRIMKDGATKSFVQAYNAQAAVDGTPRSS
jgi:hypothetical protein